MVLGAVRGDGHDEHPLGVGLLRAPVISDGVHVAVEPEEVLDAVPLAQGAAPPDGVSEQFGVGGGGSGPAFDVGCVHGLQELVVQC
jgi:hypothetical protein